MIFVRDRVRVDIQGRVCDARVADRVQVRVWNRVWARVAAPIRSRVPTKEIEDP